jgi:hypothetical protein
MNSLSAFICEKICENLRAMLLHYKQLPISGEFSRRFSQIFSQMTQMNDCGE